MVPPVPTPPTTASGTAPSGSWASVSGPSQVRFSSTFHSESNCCGAKYPGLRPSSAAFASASLTWKSPSVITCAPKAREIASRSPLIPFGITTSIRYPLTAATMLIAFPVLPLLASTMMSPGRSSPSRSARSIMYLAIRALIDPEGLRNSSLTHIPSTTTSGVLPIASRIVPPPRRSAPATGTPCSPCSPCAAERGPLAAFMPVPYVAGFSLGPGQLSQVLAGRRAVGLRHPNRYHVGQVDDHAALARLAVIPRMTQNQTEPLVQRTGDRLKCLVFPGENPRISRRRLHH